MSSLRDKTVDRLIETTVGLSLDRQEISGRRAPTASAYDAEAQVLWMVGGLSSLSLWLAGRLLRR